MTKIKFILTLFVALLCASVNAQTSWDFSSLSDADKALLDADANWTLGTNRYCYSQAISASVLTANGSELVYTKGLFFTASEPESAIEGKAKIRLNYGSSRFELNGSNIVISIKGCTAGQKISVNCKTTSSTTARGFNVGNITPVSGNFNSTSTDEQTNVGTVTADGDVTLTTSGGLYVYSIKIEDGSGSSSTPSTPESSTSNDVAMDLTRNQMRVETASSDIKYYNTESLASVEIDGAKVTVNPSAASEADVFNGNVRSLSFSKAQPTGSEGDIENADGQVKFLEVKGWHESLYAKWEAFAGAESYNVYVGDTQIDKQLVRQYSSYLRADALGLKAGSYSLKVVPVDADGNEMTSAANTATNIEVVSYDRDGFAHFGRTEGIGAYNNDGTLKSGAKVLYITANTAKTVSTKVKVDKSEATYTGFQAIVDAYQKGDDQTPIAFRIIGLVSLSDLDGISSSAEGLQVKGKSSYSTMNLTFEGVGDDAAVKGFGFLVRNSTSVEFRNFAIIRCLDDAISIDTDNSNIWIHNMDLFYGKAGSAADQKKGDGTIDVKADSKYVTIAYNHFWDNGKSSMCGLSESGENWITYHHNWFDHSDSRHARIRTMSVHMFNNYFHHNDVYSVGATMGSSVFVDRNYYEAPYRPMMISLQGTDIKNDAKGTFSGEEGGMIKSYGNVFANKTANFSYITWADNNTSFDAYEVSDPSQTVPSSVVSLDGGNKYNNFDTNTSVMYAYTPDAAADVPAIVTGYYGAGRLNHGDIVFTIPDEPVVSSGHHIPVPELANLIDGYTSPVVKIFGDGDATGSGSGDDSGSGSGSGDSGESGGSGETGGEVIEGTVLCTFEGKTPSSSSVSVTGNYSTTKGSATIDGTTYSTCVKMESSTSITFTLSAKTTVTFYFADTETASLKINSVAKTGTGSTYSETLAAGSYTIGKSTSVNLFGIKFVPAE